MLALLIGFLGAALLAGPAIASPGHYTGKGGDASGYRWDLDARITPDRSGRFRVIVTSTNATCASQTEGLAVAEGDTLRVGGSCPLVLRIKGRAAEIIEGEGCASEHGATCTYTGSLTMGR